MAADRIEPLSGDFENSMSGIAEVAKRQLGTDAPKAEFDPTSLIHFSPSLRETLSDSERQQLADRADELAPWLQGPFLVGGDLVVGGTWRTDSRWQVLGPEVPSSLAGMRVLDIGSNAGYDPFSFSLRNPDYVLACEPFAFIEQARFLESIYRTGVELRQTGWQWLDTEREGRFDLVHCHGVLYHECDPMGLLERLYEVTKPGGLCLFGSMMHADPAFADLARMVPLSYFGDDTWWWTPGPVAMRQMLESVGFRIEKTFGISAGPPGEFPTINGYFRCVRRSEG
jgi:SAM-dependent methyltransferase